LSDAIARFKTLSNSDAHMSRSDRYSVISSEDVLKRLDAEGFRIFDIKEMKVRDTTKSGFQKHVVRMRHVNQKAFSDYAPEVVMLNSFDGTSSYNLFAGALRFICSNGLIAGEAFSSHAVRHVGNVADKVAEATVNISENFVLLADNIDAMKNRKLTTNEVFDLTYRAHKLRYPNAENDNSQLTINHEILGQCHRFEDRGNDLWSVFNRVQENATRGGVGQTTWHNGRRRRVSVRGIRGIDASVKLNRQLFDLAQTYLAA
jgi:hypothetical protein